MKCDIIMQNLHIKFVEREKNVRKNESEFVQSAERYRQNLDILASKVVKLLLSGNLHIATAESCTGGLLSELITSVPGASDVFELGICSYSDRIKHEILGVPDEELENFSAVSSQVAVSMIRGIKRLSSADICVSVTGIAGPSGGTPDKPVGTVYTAFSYGNREFSKLLRLCENGECSRDIIRLRTAEYVFETVEQLLMEEVQ